MSQRARSFLGRLGGPGALLTLSGACLLASNPDLSVAGIAQLAQAGLNVADARHALLGMLTGRAHQAGSASALASVTRLGGVASGVGAFLNGRDAFNAFAEGNLTSGAFYTASAGCCGALALAGLTNVWNPGGWVLLGLAAGSMLFSGLGAATRDPDRTMLRDNGWLAPPPPPPVPTLGG